MSTCTFQDGTVVSDYGRPYIVAEVNSSHNGNMETARKMIDAAVDIGCDCVKFQSWSADSLYSKSYYKENPIARRIVEKVSVTSEDMCELARYCKSKGIAFASTPYSPDEVDFLVEECKVPYIKIASMELDHLDFLRYIGNKKVPVVLSTGMGEMDEISLAISALEKAGVEEMVLLHCVSIYPAKLESMNLRNILGLRAHFSKYPIGFSDHTEGSTAAIAAVALGAGFLEKHLTLDRSKIGMDNGMAMEPEAFRDMAKQCRATHIGMGSEQRVVSPEEYEQRKKMRRSIVAAVDLHAGDVLERTCLSAKRPGTGISLGCMEDIIGKRLRNDVEADCLILPEDIQKDGGKRV